MHRVAVGLLLFGSGACALIYQTAWLREFRLVFGASTAATSAVIAIFMGGLGFGGILIGKRADRHPNPLLLYANLELMIAATAALTPILILGARQIYIASGGSAVMGLFFATLVRLLLAAVILAVPTLLMGGTLPAAARAVERDRDVTRRDLAFVYGLNTVGAVSGTLLSTFVLLEMLGTRRTLWAAALVNAIVGLLARMLAQRGATTTAAETTETDETARATAPRTFVLAAAATVGFAFLLMELVWYRMLAPLLGGSTFTFGLILALALLGIGLGGLAYSVFGTRHVSLAHLATTCGIEALFLAIPFALGDRLAIFALLLRSLGAAGFGPLMLSWTLVAAIVVIPAAIVAGYQFPLIIALLGRGRKDVGAHVGVGYMWNTIGAICGSLAGGFGLLPAMGAVTVWRLVIVILLLLCIASLLLDLKRSRVSWRFVTPLLMIAIAFPLLFAMGPSAAWRHSGIGAGRSGTFDRSRNGLRDWINTHRRITAWERDGIESTVAMHRENGISFIINGKSDGNVRMDAGTQVMSGMLGALLHGSVKRVLVVGMGTGSTSGWLGAIPTVQEVHTVELEPATLAIARACAAVNENAMQNPKVRITVGDAREVLLTIPAQYDLIFSEPSNPYRAGIASLFTREFYEAARRRLNDRGIFVQWLQAYEVDGSTVQTVFSTLSSVFPTVEVWQSNPGDLLLVASHQPINNDVSRLRATIGQEPFRSALYNAWRARDLEAILARFVAGSDLVSAARDSSHQTNTDDRNVVEFGFARSVGAPASFDVPGLREIARTGGVDRPRLHGGEVDWDAVVDRRISMLTAERLTPVQTGPDPADRAHRRAAQAAWLAGDPARAIDQWGRQPHPPRDPIELTMIAESLAERGDPRAQSLIDEIARRQPAEADAIRALAQMRSGELDAATDSLVRSFVAYRRDPWPLPAVMQRALRTAEEIALLDQDGSRSKKLFEAMKAPFAVYMLDDERRLRLLKIASRTASEPCNERVIASLKGVEPSVPWRSEFLEVRGQCYARVGDPLSATARRDLERYRSAEVQRTLNLN